MSDPPNHPPCVKCGHRHIAQLTQLAEAEKKNVLLTSHIAELQVDLRDRQKQLKAALAELDTLKSTHRGEKL